MSLRDRIREVGRNGDSAKLREDLHSARWQAQLMEEGMRELEMEILGDSPEWRRFGMMIERDISRSGLDNIMDLSRAMYLANPLIQRAVNVRAYYVWAQGVTYEANDDRIQELVVDPTIEDEFNMEELFGHQGALLTEIDQALDGNTFMPLFTSDDGDVAVRSVPSEEIREIIVNPQDERKVWFYRRQYVERSYDEGTRSISTKQREVLYPSCYYNPGAKPSTIDGHDVLWDAPILHLRTGGTKHMQYGIPETYAAIDWARAYRTFLEDWHTIVRSLARFAWRSVSKGKSKRERLKEKLGGGGADQGDELEEGGPIRRPPVPGSVYVGGPSDELTPINKSGATTSAEDAKPSRQMVGAAMDLPDTILSGDVQQGAMATAKTLDRPTELAMLSRQKLWAAHRERIFRHRINVMVRAGQLPGAVRRYADGVYVEPAMDPTVNVVFPPILEHDVKETVGAIVSAVTLDGKPDAGTMPRQEYSKRLMNAVGVEDVADALDQLDTEQQDAVQQAVEKLTEILEARDDAGD